MKVCSTLSWAAVVLLACGVASHAQGDGSNTTPERKGNTGWTGGAQDQPSQSGELSKASGNNAQRPATQSPEDTEAANKQPLTATGADLKGEPRRFPADKTPE